MAGLELGITTDIKDAVEAFGRIEAKATDLERGIKKLSDRMSDMGSVATKGLTVPVVAGATALGLITKQAVDFQSKMREVQTLLPKLSKEGFEELSKKALTLSKDIGIASDKVVPALYQAISAGIPEENVFNFLETAGKASVAGVTDLETSVDGLTSVVNAYGSDMLDVSEASDIMFTTVHLGKTNFEELSRSLFNVIPTAAATKISFKDVSASLALMTTQGTPTNVATTQLRQLMVELNKDTSAVAKTFKSVSGQTFPEFIASGGNLQDALKLVEEAALNNGTTISNMFGSVEAGNAALALTGKNAEKFTAMLGEMADSAGATEKAFGTMELDTGRQFEKLKAEVSALIIELGQKLLPVVNETILPLIKDTVMPTINLLIGAIGNLISVYNSLPPFIQRSSIAFLGLAASIGPALSAMGAIGKTVGSVKKAADTLKVMGETSKTAATAWKALNTAINLTPVALIATITAAAIALGVAAYKQAEAQKKLREETKKLIDTNIQNAEQTQPDIEGMKALTSQFDELAKKTKRTNDEQEKMNALADEMRRIYPDLTIKYNEHGKAIEYDIEMYKKLNAEKAKEAGQGLQANKETIEKEIQNAEARKARIEKDIAKLEENIKARERVGMGVDMYEFDEEKRLTKLKQEQIDIEKELNIAKEKNAKLIEDNKKTLGQTRIEQDNYTNSLSSTGKKYKDYIKEMKEALTEHDRSVEQMKKINEASVDETASIEKRNGIIKRYLTEISEKVVLTSSQIESLTKEYGDVFKIYNTAKFQKMQDEIDKNIEKYEKQIEVEKSLGKNITDAETQAGKSEIVRQGIEKIMEALELTGEQVDILKAKFGDLYSSDSANGFAKAFKENWADILHESINSSLSVMQSIADIRQTVFDRELELIEERKNRAIEAVDEEKKAYLKANNAMEKSERERLEYSLSQLRKRQKVALGLYEQERLRKQIEEEQAALFRQMAEEEAQAKLLEIEKNATNERLSIDYQSKMAEYDMKQKQALATIAQAYINAFNSAMSSGPAFISIPLAAVTAAMATAVGMAQLAALQQATPSEPKYLALGGVVPAVRGGINAIIGEGNDPELVAPLNDDVFRKLGASIENARQEKYSSESEIIETNTVEYKQPIFIQLNGKTLGQYILSETSRGKKIVSRRGVV